MIICRLALPYPLALVLSGAAVAQDVSDAHTVTINATYGRWDQVYALADSGTKTDTDSASTPYGLCAFSTSFSAVGPSYLLGNTGAVDNCLTGAATSTTAISKAVWSDQYKYTVLPRHAGEATGVAAATGTLITNGQGNLVVSTATLLLRANWNATILGVPFLCPTTIAGSTTTSEQTILGIVVPGLGGAGGIPSDEKTTKTTVARKDLNTACRDIIAESKVYALADGGASMARCDGTISGDATTHLILTDRHL